MTPEQYDALRAKVALELMIQYAIANGRTVITERDEAFDAADLFLSLGGYHNPPRPCEACAAKQRVIDAADAQVKSLDEAVAEATEKAKQAVDRAASLEQSLYHEANTTANLRLEIDRLKKQVIPEEAVRKLNVRSEERDFFEAQIREQEATITRMADQMEQLKSEAAGQKAWGDAQSARAKAAEDANSDMLRKIRKLEGKLAELEAQLQ